MLFQPCCSLWRLMCVVVVLVGVGAPSSPASLALMGWVKVG
jgi:hypothetical protein